MRDDEEINELLGLIEDPLPLRGDKEDSLLGELLDDLDKGPMSSPDPLLVPSAHRGAMAAAGGDDDVVVSLTDRPGAPDERSRTLQIAVAALSIAAAAALVMFALFAESNGGTPLDIADDPSVTTTVASTTPAPVLSVEEACTAFAEQVPDRLALRAEVEDGSITVADLDLLLGGFDELIVELARRDDVDDALTVVSLAQGNIRQLRSNVAAGLEPGGGFGAADDALRLLQLDAPGFESCWQF